VLPDKSLCENWAKSAAEVRAILPINSTILFADFHCRNLRSLPCWEKSMASVV